MKFHEITFHEISFSDFRTSIVLIQVLVGEEVDDSGAA